MLSQGVFRTMFMDPKVTRTFNYYLEVEAQLADI